MARSKHNYYNICWEIGWDGFCDWHRNHPRRYGREQCIPARTIPGRRLFVREERFPRYSWKSWGKGPPRYIKQYWNGQVRQISERELRRTGDINFDAGKWLAGMYGWWL